MKNDRRLQHFGEPVENLTLSLTPDPPAGTIRTPLLEVLRRVPYNLVKQSACFVRVVVGVGDYLMSFVACPPEAAVAECGNHISLRTAGMAMDENLSISATPDTERRVPIFVRGTLGHPTGTGAPSIQSSDNFIDVDH